MNDTKEFILQCAIDVCSKKKISQVTVSDISDAASINRATFYYYFNSVNSLLDELIDNFSSAAADILFNNLDNDRLNDSKDRYKKQTLALYQYYYDNQKLCHILLWSELREQFEQSFISAQIHGYKRYLIKTTTDDAYWNYNIRAYSDCMMAYTNLSFLESWAMNGFTESPAEIVEIIAKISNIGTENGIMENRMQPG